MNVEFRLALASEARSLATFDRKVFLSDHFPASQWRAYRAFWLLLNHRKVGCCAFELHVDFQDDLRDDHSNISRKGSLYIASTGILPAFQGWGLGQLFKAWQISYARLHCFSRIVTNTRKHNAAMLALNRKFGFRVLRTTPRYYSHPTDSTVVMELLLQTKRQRSAGGYPPSALG